MLFQGNQFWTILVLTSFLGLVLEVKGSPKKTEPSSKNACFVVGTTPLPSDVVVNQALAQSCIKGSSAFSNEKNLKQLPDILFNNVKFTDISYVKRKAGTSAVRFALDTFGKMSKADLQTRLELYTAINAGLRSIGGPDSRRVLGDLKGVDFLLSMLIGVADKNQAIVTRNKGKTLKNCNKCTPQDRQAVEAAANRK